MAGILRWQEWSPNWEGGLKYQTWTIAAFLVAELLANPDHLALVSLLKTLP